MYNNFNPQGPRGPRRKIFNVSSRDFIISIHKALAGLDRLQLSARPEALHFNPQGPRGPRLNAKDWHLISPDDFNPQGPRGPRHQYQVIRGWYSLISIHKALAGLDWDGSTVLAEMQGFQSTRPSRASTNVIVSVVADISISIHKALAGLDV